MKSEMLPGRGLREHAGVKNPRASLTSAMKVHLDGRRSVAVWIAVVLGLLIAIITELESALHLLAFVPVLLVWVAIAVGAALALSRMRWHLPTRPRVDSLSVLMITGSLLIAVVIGVTAWISPPNLYDVITYHLPRIIYWAQNRSVAVYPTLYPHQNLMPPFAEYTQLQLYILSRGGDRFPNLIPAAAFAGILCVVSLIARELGANIRGQAIACLGAATIPAAVVQAPDAQNDVFLAFWLVAMAWFAVRYAKWLRSADLIGIAATFLGWGFSPREQCSPWGRRCYCRLYTAHSARDGGNSQRWPPLSLCSRRC